MQAKWLDIGPVTQIEPGMAATLPVIGGEEIAVFHTMRGEFYALALDPWRGALEVVRVLAVELDERGAEIGRAHV